MASSSQLVDESPKHPRWIIGGIPIVAIGYEDLCSTKDIKGIFLLHGRMQRKEKLYDFAEMIHKQCSTEYASALVICVDQRNHGERIVDPDQNKGWQEGNVNHAMGIIDFN
jgi:hypothetical protein